MQTRESLEALTPESARALLEEGNRRFRERQRLEQDLLAQVDATKGGQSPFAIVLGCIDSRVSAELVFDQGVGDVFSVRIAGNCINPDILGSMEFACEVVGSKLVVVLGHSRCGAVMGACDGVELGNLTGLLARIRPAVDRTKEPADPDRRSSKDAEFVQNVTLTNVRLAIDEIRERSPVLKRLEDEGRIAIVGAMYDVGTGAVEFL